MSVQFYDKSGDEPVRVLMAGTSATDLLLDENSTNAIANRAVYAALAEKVGTTVNNLLNYYTKDETFTKTEVQNLINSISTMDIKVVDELPTSNISTTTIYFVPSAMIDGYEQFVYVENAWVKIGDTEVDLSDYLKNEDFVIRIADYYTKAQIEANYYTKTQTDTLLNNKQDKLTFDSTPTSGSNNPVTSKGIRAAIDAIQGGTGSNPNILDNGWFTINQRYGQTSDTSMYFNAGFYNRLTVDRWWHKLGAGATITHYRNQTNGNYLVINSSGQWGRMEQFIEREIGDSLVGKKVVMSAIVSTPSATKIRMRFGRYNGSTIYDTSGQFISADIDVPAGATKRLIVSSPLTINATSDPYTHYSFLFYPQFSGGSTARTGINVTIHAIKLEVSDGGSTLAKDSAPNMEQELARCQRFQYIIRGSDGMNILTVGYPTSTTSANYYLDLPVTMYKEPALYVSGESFYITMPGSSSNVGVDSSSIVGLDSRGLCRNRKGFYIRLSTSHPYTIGDPVLLGMSTTGCMIQLVAELWT